MNPNLLGLLMLIHLASLQQSTQPQQKKPSNAGNRQQINMNPNSWAQGFQGVQGKPFSWIEAFRSPSPWINTKGGNK